MGYVGIRSDRGLDSFLEFGIGIGLGLVALTVNRMNY